MNIDTIPTHFKIDKMLGAIMNVVNNVLSYSPYGGTIHVAVYTIDSLLQISVIDEGTGFSMEVLKHAKE